MLFRSYKGAIVDGFVDGAKHVVAFDSGDINITNIKSYSLYD